MVWIVHDRRGDNRRWRWWCLKVHKLGKFATRVWFNRGVKKYREAKRRGMSGRSGGMSSMLFSPTLSIASDAEWLDFEGLELGETSDSTCSASDSSTFTLRDR